MKVAGPAGEKLVGGLKLKGMTVFSTESSWCEKAMPSTSAGNWSANALIFSGKPSR
ncbi:hypothetical protein [Pseudomonas sp. FP1742]|uniref:hypothetical protein n=1 Tax=Pseudomonas sp. FP1742 TaxID=2954079 RepID=UPI0027345B0B|nr:hypothetical protein [Pseudomonas sp. FP1742]WLG50751.1 hypothetical protein PSH64_29360 [Pseudomonas sp. FP1742]